MPNINLRLTEEEHAQLFEWAHGSRRSLQREIVFRLFDGALVGGSGVPGVGTTRTVTRAAEPPELPTSASVQPKVQNRRHMRRDRPALECSGTSLPCDVCGAPG